MGNFMVMFDVWLFSNAHEEISDMYISQFTHHFREYLNDAIEEQLSFAGKNILYALQAYVSNTTTLHELLIFTEKIVDIQLENFLYDYDLPEWCDENFEPIEEEKTTPSPHRQSPCGFSGM